MTPKEKAEELVNSMNRAQDQANHDIHTLTPEAEKAANDWHDKYGHLQEPFDNEVAKQCALIAVEEIINALDKLSIPLPIAKEYFKEVKQEIEKL